MNVTMRYDQLLNSHKGLVDLVTDLSVSTVLVNHEENAIDIFYRDGKSTRVLLPVDESPPVDNNDME